MKKKVNTKLIMNEMQGSVFFPTKSEQPEPEMVEEAKEIQKPVEQSQPFPSQSIQPKEKKESLLASNSASSLASTLAQDTDLEIVRKVLKLVGKEVLYVRLTPEEKGQVSDIEYTYQRQGIKTSSNEIGRIAINFILVDYKNNGENSIFAKVISALHT